LAQLGQKAGASERTLSRLFRSELGMTFHQWRTRLRVQRALVHLARGLSVTETAAQLGSANPTSFIDAFRAVVGYTLGKYTSRGRTER
jgi:AraC-like DNA-binding protein